ncbi:MAG: glycosyltransferase [Erysipelotrichaceae bacterium]
MSNQTMENFVSAVIYVHNHQKCIKKFLEEIYQVLDKSFKNFEIICVDDGSVDNSACIIKELAMNFNNTVVSLISMGKENGIETSMKAGIDASIGDFVFEFEKPYENFELSLLIDVFNKSLLGYDIVNCKNTSNEKFASRLFYFLFNHFSNIKNSISTEAFRVVSRRAINRIDSMNTNSFFRKALYANCGLQEFDFSYKGEKTHIKEKSFSESRITTACDAMLLFTKIGYKISLTLTLFMILFSVSVLIFTLIVYFNGQTIEGWTPIMLFMSFSFLGFFLIFTIIIKYMDLLINLNHKKREYTIESIEKITK